MKLTKEQAIENLYNIIKFGGLMMSAEYVESVRMATEAYEHEPGKDMGRYDPYTDSFVTEDCISRQAVVEMVEGWWLGHTKDDDLSTEIQKLPSVQSKVVPIAEIRFDDDKLHEIIDEAIKDIEITPRWIPVSERLPEEVSNYLTSIRHYGEEHFVQVSFFDGVSFKAEVEAWMPLPEPYKAESEVENADSN